MMAPKEEIIRKGPWTEQEDMQLILYVGLFGERRWDFLAKVSGLNRTGKSCRLRWVNYLHPCLKRGRITPQEEKLILELHARWGNRWSRIARRLPGRTDNEIKNYWRTHMRKKAQESKKNACNSQSSSSTCCSLSPYSASKSTPAAAPVPAVADHNYHYFNPNFETTEAVKGYYSMDQIWKEIETSESVSGLSFEECCLDEACNCYCPPVPSPMWEYSCDSLWKMDEEDEQVLSQCVTATTTYV